jgi:hypothetical protein
MTNKKIQDCEMIARLQKRLKKSYEIQKENKNDNEVNIYQSGRQIELEYCIGLLLTPYQRLKLSTTKNRSKYFLLDKLADPKERDKFRPKKGTFIPFNSY